MAFPVLAATPAQAAGTGVASPANGAVITSGSVATVRANIGTWPPFAKLWVDVPGVGDTYLTSRTGRGSMSGTVSVRRNGRYKVTVRGSIFNDTYATSTFTVRIPPARPSGLSTSVSGRNVTVRWNLGLEDDLTGYTVSGNGVTPASGGVDRFCSGTSCSATLKASGNVSTASISVRAQRPSGTGGSVASGASIARATFSNGDNGGSTPPPSSNVPTTPPGTTPPSQTPLTPFNNQSPVTLPSVQPPGSTPGFTYPAPQVLGTSAPKATNAAATDSLQWGKSIGIALILLVIAAHLGTWTRRLRVAQAGVSDKGMAARMARAGVGRKRVARQREQIARAEALAKTVGTSAKPGRSTKAAVKDDKAPGATRTAVLAVKAGDTKTVSAAAKTPAAKPAKPARRRPATLGKRQSGVEVRIAGKDGAQPARGHRSRKHRKSAK